MKSGDAGSYFFKDKFLNDFAIHILYPSKVIMRVIANKYRISFAVYYCYVNYYMIMVRSFSTLYCVSVLRHVYSLLFFSSSCLLMPQKVVDLSQGSANTDVTSH